MVSRDHCKKLGEYRGELRLVRGCQRHLDGPALEAVMPSLSAPAKQRGDVAAPAQWVR